METIHAVWEKRNLGLDAYEVRVQEGESAEQVREALRSIHCDYTVVRAPVGRLDLYEMLTQEGFSFAETMIMLEHDLSEVPLPEHKREINRHLSLEPMTEEEFPAMLEVVKSGLYKTDRISLDPHFTMAQSANRYYCWLQDEWKNGSLFYKLTHKGEYIGFLDLKKCSETEYQDEFTGIFPQHAGKGYAIGFTTKLVELLRKTEAKTIYAEISSNNIASLQSRMRYGYRVLSYFYVFVKHHKE